MTIIFNQHCQWFYFDFVKMIAICDKPKKRKCLAMWCSFNFVKRPGSLEIEQD